jgi:hypothetical protein
MISLLKTGEIDDLIAEFEEGGSERGCHKRLKSKLGRGKLGHNLYYLT